MEDAVGKCEVAIEGVGDRDRASLGNSGVGGVKVELPEIEARDEPSVPDAGTGVATPSALASFASRWGGNGAFGAGHDG